jgi:predicted SAM-dependent methyltransferase
MRLILGAGAHHNKLPGEYLVDRIPFPGVDKVHDLDEHPWPFDDNAADSIAANHLVEHLRSLLVPFMDECWRILKPGGSLYLQTPLAGANSDLEFCDPTHVRCYRVHSFVNYLSPEGVAQMGYTNRAWNFFHLHATPEGVLIVHAYPLKR